MDILIRPMILADYEAASALWQQSEGIALSGADSKENIARYLERNPRGSYVACDQDQELLVGAVLCGHDARRGYLYHLAVSPLYHQRGIARSLVKHALADMHAAGIERTHIVVLANNPKGMAFWEALGWKRRDGLVLMSYFDEDLEKLSE